MQFHPSLQDYLKNLLAQPFDLASDRPERLRAITDHVRASLAARGEAHINFICTHNSRRSQLAQVWAGVAADYYGIRNVFTWSGGSEETMFAPQAIAALERCGFRIDRSNGANPQYSISWSDERKPLQCFSKVYDHPSNPKKDFAAVMVCSQAETACPFVAGASSRISLPFNDPKETDNTPEEELVYDARNRQIARVLLHAFSQIDRT